MVVWVFMSREEFKEHDFYGLGIAPGLLKRIKALGFVHPTPIQFKAIPIATSGEDVVGIAQTGSGKTLAFAIPMLQQISKTNKMGLVLLPTRELAVQVEETFRKVAGPTGLRTAIIIGGTNPKPQIRQLKAKPHVIVATPGRLIDHVENRRISLNNVSMLVLDEADRMLDMGFAPQLDRILKNMPDDRQTMLFSATMPSEIVKIAKKYMGEYEIIKVTSGGLTVTKTDQIYFEVSNADKYMQKPLRIEVAKSGTTVDTIDQEVYVVPRSEKMDLLEKLLHQYKGSVLIFSRTKHGAAKIARKIRKQGHSADEIHSNRSQNQRQKALKGFASGRYRILVATDIAARGIDVDDIELVLNFDLPEQIDDYVHRIGRTGRAGRSGKAISFAAPEQKSDVAQIQRLINITLPIKSPAGESLKSISKTETGGSQKKKSGQGRRRNKGGARSRHGGGGGSRGKKFTPKRKSSGKGRPHGKSHGKKRSPKRRK